MYYHYFRGNSFILNAQTFNLTQTYELELNQWIINYHEI